MKKLIHLFLILLFSLVLTSCNLRNDSPSDGENENNNKVEEKPDDGQSNNDSNNNQNENKQPQSPDENLLKLKDDIITNSISYDDLFDINNTIEIDLNISEKELEKIEKDYQVYSSKNQKSPIYRKCDSVTINIIKDGKSNVFVFYDVGIRMKGNTSRHSFYNNNNLTSNIHFKLSFKETFDDSYYNSDEKTNWDLYEKNQRNIRKNRTFLGLEKLDLRYNKTKDKSYIKEYYASSMYNYFGILTPKMNFSKLKLNYGKKSLNYGIYLVTEPLDDVFIKKHLESGGYLNMGSLEEELSGSFGDSNKIGQLYKASYSYSRPDMTSSDDKLFGVETESFTPTYELKTNKKKNDNTLIKNMINTLNSKGVDEISKVVDLEYFALYEAISTVISDPDCLRNNYNNYAMYFRKTDGLMVIIPIDLDRSFGIGLDYNPWGDCNSSLSPFNDICSNKEKQVNNLYLKTILTNSYVKDLYIEKLNEVLNSKWMEESYFNSIYEIVKSKYSEFEKNSFYSIGITNNEKYKVDSENMSFKDFIIKRKEVILSSLNPSSSLISNLSNFYLTGTFDNWNKTTEKYKFSEVNKTTFEYYYQIDSDRLEFKVYNSDKSIWLRCENGNALHEGGSNIIINNLVSGKYIHFVIDTKNGILNWEILDNIN